MNIEQGVYSSSPQPFLDRGLAEGCGLRTWGAGAPPRSQMGVLHSWVDILCLRRGVSCLQGGFVTLAEGCVALVCVPASATWPPASVTCPPHECDAPLHKHDMATRKHDTPIVHVGGQRSMSTAQFKEAHRLALGYGLAVRNPWST